MPQNKYEDIAYFIDIFQAYTKPYLQLENYTQSVSIKIKHSLHVYELASKICSEIPEHLAFSLQLAALFHDIGRFEQIRIYGTFMDKISVNHGLLGAKILRKEGFIAHLPKEIQKHVYTAIVLHNRYKLPNNLPSNYLTITNALRDSDKVDILRVMVENYDNPNSNSDMVNLNVKDEPFYTPKILESLLNKQAIAYSDLVYVNDFRLLQGGWLNDIHFRSPKEEIKRKGYINKILKGLPKNKEMDLARKFILSLLEE